MPVPPIVTQQRPYAPRGGAPRRPESPLRQADPGRLLQLGRLDADVMSVSLAILAGRQPDLFDALVAEAAAYAEAETEPEPEPFCVTCGADAGIFWLLGPEWHHYRPGSETGDSPQVYEPGHIPVIGWRIAEAEIPRPGNLGRSDRPARRLLRAGRSFF